MFEEYVEALNREMPLGKRKPEPKFEFIYKCFNKSRYAKHSVI